MVSALSKYWSSVIFSFVFVNIWSCSGDYPHQNISLISTLCSSHLPPPAAVWLRPAVVSAEFAFLVCKGGNHDGWIFFRDITIFPQ